VQGLRTEFEQRRVNFVVERLKFIDESGINLAMTPRYGRAAPGMRVMDRVPHDYGANLSLLAALGSKGVNSPMMVEGAVDSAAFRAYVTQVLGPTLKPGDIVMLDNLAVHKVAGIAELIERRGARLQPLPPYSPELNPIEQCWAKLKTALRQAQAAPAARLTQHSSGP
jgi:transposase